MDDFLFNVNNGIGNMIINRPEKRNALNDKVLNGICDAINKANNDPNIRLLSLTGAGDKAFSSGGDIGGLQSFENFGPAGSYFARSLYSNTLIAMSGSLVPIIGIANGYVLAGALGIFLSCDITVAVETAKFGLPEINIGMYPMMVMSVLFKNIGRKKAMELLLLGEKISAQDALSYGILNKVFPVKSFNEDVSDYITKFAQKPGIVTRLGKTAFNAIEGIDKKSIEILQLSLGNVMQTQDFNEGIMAFLEKRQAKWNHK